MKFFPSVLLGAAWLISLPCSGQDTAEAQLAQARANEQRVRDTLRSTTQQLRAAEAEKASLLAAQSERDQKIAELEARVAAVTKQAAQDRQEADQSIASLTAAGQRKDEELARLSTTLAKWKASHAQATALLKKGEATRSKLQATNLTLERTIATRERQNLELYKTGSEILQRYADFGFGRALTAREPFTGLARVRLEEQVQGYADRLQDAKLKPATSDGRPSTQPVPAASSAPSSSADSTPTIIQPEP